jgi:hypothetical protein
MLDETELLSVLKQFTGSDQMVSVALLVAFEGLKQKVTFGDTD